MSGRAGSVAIRGERPARFALVVAVTLLATGCAQLGVAPRPSPPAAPGAAGQDRGDASGSAEVESEASRPAAPAPRANAASSTLLAQSRGERNAGNHAAAVATLERALRIDPNNAALWIEVGEVQLERGNAAQAASMARKALTLTAGDAALTRRAERLLDAAAR